MLRDGAASNGKMSGLDVFLLIVRWLHLVAAAVWIGGGLFYLLVLRSAFHSRSDSRPSIGSEVAVQFRVVVDISMIVLVATGVVIAFNRLTGAAVGPAYVVTLGIKVALSVWMFLLVMSERRKSAVMAAYREPPARPPGTLQRLSQALSGYSGVIIVGIVVFLLSDLLKVLYELGLPGD